MRRIGDPPSNSDSEGNLPPYTQPQKRASTASIFCAKHDGPLFTYLEDTRFIPDPEQLFLLAFRTVAHELSKLTTVSKTEGLMFKLDRGCSKQDQAIIQNIAAHNQSRNARALQEVAALKSIFDKAWSARNWGRVKSLAIKVNSPIPVASSALVVPEFGFDGSFLQQSILGLPTAKYFSFSLLPTQESESFAIWSWVGDDRIAIRLLNSLKTVPTKNIGNALIIFAFEYSENTFANPTWWRDLSNQSKTSLLRRMKPEPFATRDSSCLRYDLLDYWVVDNPQHSIEQI